MPKIAKIAFIIVVATLAIAATRLLPNDSHVAGASATIGASISPHEMMRNVGPLPETKVDHYQ